MIKTIAVASFIGTAIEAYDLYIYGFVLGPLFFPGFSDTAQTLAAFFSEQFETRVRCSGISLGYNLGGIVGGAFTR